MLKNYIERRREISDKKGHVFERLKYSIEEPDVIFIGNYAKHDLNSIVYAYSVGFKDLYEKYLGRSINWISEGINNNEQ